MQIHGRKTKEKMVSFKKIKQQVDPITNEDGSLETVDHYKLLWTWTLNKMTLKYHVTHIAGTSLILHHLKQLRRCGVATEDQLMFYKSVIVPRTM